MGVGMIIAIGLLIFFFASPFLILARVTGIAREIREIKGMLKNQKNSNAIPLVTQKVEAVPNVACKPKPATRPVVPPHVEYDLTPLGVEVAAKVHALAACIEGNLAQIIQPRSG